MVNGIVSLISLSVFSLLVYRNFYRGFCVLILYPDDVFRVFYVEDHVICKQWEFYFSFSNLDSIYFFFFSDCHASDFQNCVSKIDESGHPYLFPDLRGNAFSFPLLSMILAVGLSYMAFIMLKYAPSMSNFWRVL